MGDICEEDEIYRVIVTKQRHVILDARWLSQEVFLTEHYDQGIPNDLEMDYSNRFVLLFKHDSELIRRHIGVHEELLLLEQRTSSESGIKRERKALMRIRRLEERILGRL